MKPVHVAAGCWRRARRVLLPGERVAGGCWTPAILIDFLDQFFDAAKRPATNGLLRNPIKPDLHLIQPRGIGRGEVHVKSWPCGEPAFYPWMFVRSVVAHTAVHLQALRHVFLDLP